MSLTVNGEPFPPAGGGGTHTSGTLAARPAVPVAGDTYAVTSGAGAGDVYLCAVAALWTLLGPDSYAVSYGGTGGPFAGITAGQTILSIGTVPAEPTFAPGQSLVCCVYPTSDPVGGEVVACHAGPGLADGWALVVGAGADLGELSLYLVGLTAYGRLVGATWTGALNAPHTIAVRINAADQSVDSSWDGGAVVHLAPLVGVYIPPIASDKVCLGAREDGGTSPLASAQMVAMRTYSTELSDGDLIAASAAHATYQIPPVTGTVTLDWHARDHRTSASKATLGHTLWARPGHELYARG